MLVWQEGDGEYAGSRLVLLNLNTQSKTSIEAGEGEYISILGFMEEDMIYGLTKQSDIVESSTGEVMLPMYCVRIQSMIAAVSQPAGYDLADFRLQIDRIHTVVHHKIIDIDRQ